MSGYALPRMVGDVVRLCPEASRAGAYMTVMLEDAPWQEWRGKTVALYRVAVSFSWRPDLDVLRLADSRGDPVEWQFVELAAWLAERLDGWPLVVTMEFNARRLSAPYVGRRLVRQRAYMEALSAGEFRAQAQALRDKWAHQEETATRRAAAEKRAEVLDAVAGTLDVLRGVAP